MRLDKYLSKALDLSRNEVRSLITDGLIKVNNQIIRKKDFYINEEADNVIYNDKVLEYREFVYYMLNKPAGYISANKDKEHKTVIDLLDIKKEVFVVGRLDIDTEGLILLTNNGEFAHNLTSPKHKVVKKYYVKSELNITQKMIDMFESGLEILDGSNNKYITQAAKLEVIDEKQCYVYISEGKFHQIKRMFEAIGNQVVYLKRISIGSLVLDESLKLGEYRMLTDEEVMKLKKWGIYELSTYAYWNTGVW